MYWCKLFRWTKQLTNGNVAHLLLLQLLPLTRVKNGTLEDTQMPFLSYTVKSSQLLNHNLHSLPTYLLWKWIAFQKNTGTREMQWTFSSDTQSQTRVYVCVGVHVYNILSKEKFLKLVSAAARVMAMFGRTYAYEQLFIWMNNEDTTTVKIHQYTITVHIYEQHYDWLLHGIDALSGEYQTCDQKVMGSISGPASLRSDLWQVILH